MACPHEQTEAIVLPVTFQEIGKMCVACFESLPSWWGCPDCYFEISMTMAGDRFPYLVEPCFTHYHQYC